MAAAVLLVSALVVSVVALRDRLRLIARLVRFRVLWGRHDSHRKPDLLLEGKMRNAVLANPKFCTPAEAVAAIPDGATVLSCGFGGNDVVFAFYLGIRERFDADQHPRDLTWLCCNANGARGVAPGSCDELARPGLLRKYIAGHLETVKAILAQGQAGNIELHNIPNLTLAQLIAQQAETGKAPVVETEVGVGTFLDPRCGRGTCVTSAEAPSFTTVADNGTCLRYTAPAVDVVLVNAKRCDINGNVYLDGNVTITECLEGPRAVKHEGRETAPGLVLVSVQEIVPVDDSVPSDRLLPASMVDHICVCDAIRMQDPVGVRADFAVRPLAPGTRPDPAMYEKAWNTLRFINTFIGATPKRSEKDLILGRLASTIFVDTFRGAEPTDDGRLLAAIGVGLPEEVSHNIFQARLAPGRITLCTESGTIGGLPGMGMFFGAAIHPEKVLSEAGIYEYLRGRLNTCCVGALEVDVLGNVNVSNRGPLVTNFVGTGGFSNLVHRARHVVIVFSWRTDKPAKNATGKLVHVRSSAPHLGKSGSGNLKLVERVRQVTLCGAEALRQGKRVTYCTNVGVFRLVEGPALELTHVYRGTDPKRDIADLTGLPIRIAPQVATIDESILTGRGFDLAL